MSIYYAPAVELDSAVHGDSYSTCSRHSPPAGIVGPAECLPGTSPPSVAVTRLAVCSADRRPQPASSNVPASIRTMLYRNLCTKSVVLAGNQSF